MNERIIMPLLSKIADEGFGRSAVVVELEEGPKHGELLAELRADPLLSVEVSSVDGTNSFEGVLALVGALDQLPVTGHYGLLPSADQRLPG